MYTSTLQRYAGAYFSTCIGFFCRCIGLVYSYSWNCLDELELNPSFIASETFLEFSTSKLKQRENQSCSFQNTFWLERHWYLALRFLVVSFHSLNNLFYGVGVENVLCHHIFCCMLKVAAQGKSTGNVETDLEVVRWSSLSLVTSKFGVALPSFPINEPTKLLVVCTDDIHAPSRVLQLHNSIAVSLVSRFSKLWKKLLGWLHRDLLWSCFWSLVVGQFAVTCGLSWLCLLFNFLVPITSDMVLE